MPKAAAFGIFRVIGTREQDYFPYSMAANRL